MTGVAKEATKGTSLLKWIKIFKENLQSDMESSIAITALLGSLIPVLIGVLRTSSNVSVPSTLGSPLSSRIVTSID